VTLTVDRNAGEVSRSAMECFLMNECGDVKEGVDEAVLVRMKKK
jgi:hypothetical protein